MDAMKALVLAYHSHNISGTTYATNDHVAFASDLRVLTSSHAHIVDLPTIVAAMREGLTGPDVALVAITFDDGPLFDYADFTHPLHGPQRSFLNIMQDFRAEAGNDAQPTLHATSFVIASPHARRAMEKAPECGYTYLQDWLTDDWWDAAVDTGLMGIGNHSWDHVHPAVDSIATRSQVRGDFGMIDDERDADAEIRAASDFINARVRGRCDMFAYPFGHVNDFLAKDYLPNQRGRHGMKAAFGTGGRAISREDSVWDIPRAVCGHHWHSPEELVSLLAG
jgi:peptidoglycan/xylan/chitin deacetylase (PgdA/CDA1 family)